MPSPADPLPPPLIGALAELLEAEPRPEAIATARALRTGAALLALRPGPPPRPSSMAAAIARTCGLPDAHPAARLVAAAQGALAWADSPAASLQPTALAAIKSIVELLGPEGPILAPDLRFGLFWQAPGTYYPLHAHTAAETYTLLAGRADWQAGDRRLRLGAGEAVHHPPELPHAMRAGPDGFLAIWRWSGDVGFESYRMLPDPQA
jgi:quercetin dioxygenase-like cupin family protein